MVLRTVPARSSRAGASRGRQSKREQEDYEIPEVYREMLVEAEARDSQGSETDRPMKRRRVGERTAVSSQPGFTSQQVQAPESSEDAGQQMQTAYDSTASEESDMEWEEVDIHQAPQNLGDQGISISNDEPLQITLDQQKDNIKRVIPRRKPVTGAEKRLRLEIHKLHLLCLLGHVQIRNLWCNDEQVQVCTCHNICPAISLIVFLPLGLSETNIAKKGGCIAESSRRKTAIYQVHNIC